MYPLPFPAAFCQWGNSAEGLNLVRTPITFPLRAKCCQQARSHHRARSSNFLALNKTEVAKQEKAAAKARAEAERSRNVALSEDELYSMGMDELRMRGLGVWNK